MQILRTVIDDLYELAKKRACCFSTKSFTPKVWFGDAGLILDSMFHWI